jgi:hypothetical protein
VKGSLEGQHPRLPFLWHHLAEQHLVANRHYCKLQVQPFNQLLELLRLQPEAQQILESDSREVSKGQRPQPLLVHIDT